MKTFIQKHYLHIFLVFLILSIGAVLRFYRINEYMAFLGDEGRDVLVVKRIIVDHQFTLLGPITSVGSVYMGPVYYYFMVPFLWAFRLNPAGPAVMVALFSLATIFLVYRFGAEFFHSKVGLVASFLYAISPLTILYGRASWNPNVVPFFALLLIYSLTKTFVQKKEKWFAISGLSLGILLQLHYVTFVFLPIIFFVCLLHRFRISKKAILGALIFALVAYSPVFFFEIRHGFVNFQGIIRFFIEGKNSSNDLFLYSFISIFLDIFVRLFWRTLIVVDADVAKIIILATAFIFVWKRKFIAKNTPFKESFKILLVWLFVGLFFLSFYRGSIYDYYLGAFYPLPFLLFGIGFYFFLRGNAIHKVLAGILFMTLTVQAMAKSPVMIEPNNLVKNTQEVAQFIYDRTHDRPYNFALIALGNSDHAYRYFLEVWNDTPIVIQNQVVDPDRKSVTNDLWVVCEEKICQPLGHALWEIAGFGRAEIAGEWKVSTAKVFHLIRYTQSNEQK